MGPGEVDNQDTAAHKVFEREETLIDHETMTETMWLNPAMADVSFFTLPRLNVNCCNNNKVYWIMLWNLKKKQNQTEWQSESKKCQKERKDADKTLE